MIDNTINDDRAVAGGGEDMILAGRYHILRQKDKKYRLVGRGFCATHRCTNSMELGD